MAKQITIGLMIKLMYFGSQLDLDYLGPRVPGLIRPIQSTPSCCDPIVADRGFDMTMEH